MGKTYVGGLFARNIKRYRAVLNLTQEGLAEKVGCSTTTIGRIESQQRFASPALLGRIAKALKVHPSELFQEEPGALKKLKSKYEVKERLESTLKQAIDDAWDDDEAEGRP